jgi:hypothetical protein
MRPESSYDNKCLNELRNIYDEMENKAEEPTEPTEEDAQDSPPEIITSEDVKNAVPENERVASKEEDHQNSIKDEDAKNSDGNLDDEDDDDIDIEKEMEELDIDDADLDDVSDVELSDE